MTDWTPDEDDKVVRPYFEMLRAQLADRHYIKAKFIRTAISETGRSRGSIEFKFENISAVLHEAGLIYIDGYKPAKNYSAGLARRVAAFLQHAQFALPRSAPAAPRPIPPVANPYVSPPSAAHPRRTNILRAGTGMRLDYAEQEAANRELGRAGEEWIVGLERARLARAGRADLADLVVHASVDVGDGLGYDIASFRNDGTELFIEVKTTTRSRSAPFFVSAGELEFARRNASQYELHRVFDWGRSPRAYRLGAPLEGHARLDPVVFRAVLRAAG